jgi:ribokinase
VLIVFGSIKLDIAFRAPRLPAPGETVLGRDYTISPGGKGANQAHAAQRYGMATALFGAVGDDAFAAPALAMLEKTGVDLAGVQVLSGQTGCAGITVDAEGRNQIVVAPGVNLALRQDCVPAATLARAKAVLLQMETDPNENWALIARARKHDCMTVLNNAPAHPIPRAVLDALDILIVNEVELAQTAQAIGLETSNTDNLLQTIAQKFSLTLVLTLGRAGAVCCSGGMLTRTPAMKVDVVDTTGAGDTFAAVLTSALIEGRSLDQALAVASVAAGLACTRPGAQIAQPDRREIDEGLPRSGQTRLERGAQTS